MIRKLRAHLAPAAPPPGPPTGQCSYFVPDPPGIPGWRLREFESHSALRGKVHTNCMRDSVIEIEGKPYCRIHGGFIMLGLWEEGRLTLKEKP